MPKSSGSGHTVTLEAGGRSVTLTAEEFDRRWLAGMTPEERTRFLERGKREEREEERR